MSIGPTLGARVPRAAGIQSAADVHAIAQRLDDAVRAAHADLGSVAPRLDAEDWSLLRGVEHLRADLVTLHSRLVALGNLADATIERARLLVEEDAEP